MQNFISYRMSIWAKKHRLMTIAVMAVAKTAIAITGLCLGIIAWHYGLTLPEKQVEWFLLAVAVGCIVAYPSKRMKTKLGYLNYYKYQKSCDGILAAFGLAFFFFLGNLSPAWVAQPDMVLAEGSAITTVVSSIKKEVYEQPVAKARGSKFKQWIVKKAKSKITRLVDKVLKKVNKLKSWEVGLYCFLLVVLAVLLVGLVAYLACGFFCAGQEAMALLVLLGGLTGVVFMLIYGFREIKRKGSPKKEKE